MNIKFLLLLLIIPLLTITVHGISNSYETTYDGDVTGSTITNTTHYVNASSNDGTCSFNQFTFFEFDLSDIPTGSTITSVNITTNISGNSGWNNPDRFRVTNITLQPSITFNAANLFGSLGPGFYTGYGPRGIGITTIDLPNAVPYLQTIIDNDIDWFALALYPTSCETLYGQNNYLSIHSSNGTNYHPTLQVTFTPNTCYAHSPTPAIGAIEQSTNTSLSIELVNPVDMNYTLTWQWLNDTVWQNFSTNTSLPDNWPADNYTYTATYLNATSGGTLYYWRVYCEDEFGNSSLSPTFYFTTEGNIPPTSASCTRINETAFNISFTPSTPPIGGTVHTICRYQTGYSPPAWDEGTFGFNTTLSWYNVSSLNEGDCYSFSLWTNTNVSGNWTLSSSRTFITPCCTAGGSYNIIFRYENSSYDPITENYYNNYINFSDYPCSTHLLTIHYPNNYDDYFYLSSTWYELNGNSSIFYVETPEEPLYFELHWNWSVNLSCSDCSKIASYTRKLTPHASSLIDGNSSITFYMITDRPVFNEYYSYNSSGNCTEALETELNDNLVQFDFQFEDRTHLFDVSNFQSWARIYAYNTTTKIIIHEEYLDTQQQIHPTVIFRKKYFIGVNGSHPDSHLYENIGLLPNWQWVYPYEARTIIINPYISTSIDTSDLTIRSNWLPTGTGLYVYFLDNTFTTDTINCTITEGDSVVYTSEKNTQEWNFSFLAANQTYAYFIQLDITINSTITTISWWIFPYSSQLTLASAINTTMTAIFGYLPSITRGSDSYSLDYSTIITVALFLIVFSILSSTVSVSVGILGGGISMLGFTTIVYGLLSVFPYLSMLIIFIGVLALIKGDN